MILDLLAAATISVLLILLLMFGLRWELPMREGTRGGAILLFLLLTLLVWAGGVWTQPFGPSLYGVYWLPFVMVALLLLLLLATLIPPRRSFRRRSENKAVQARREMAEAEEVAVRGWLFSIAFWVLVLLTLLVITLRYTTAPRDDPPRVVPPTATQETAES